MPGPWHVIGILGLAGLAFALLAHATLLVLAGRAGGLRSLVYLSLVILVASLLAWQGIVRLTWLTPLLGLALLLAAAGVLLAEGRRPRLPSLSRLEWFTLLLLAVAALYAAFPDYRPDQWNNDLVLAKAVAEGPLHTPIFEEHVYCGGIYQYLFTLPRRLSGDDVFNQCAADAFSWLLLSFGLWGLFARMRAEMLPRLPPVVVLVAWAVFALPDDTALANAKADPLILLAAIAVLDLSTGPRASDSRALHGALLGFLLVAPLALKLTWIHFLAAAFLAWLFLLAIRRPVPAPAWGPFAIGVAAGAVAWLPYALTNLRFFGNPLHPAQFGPLRSSYWGEAFGRYWGEAAGRATSLRQYLEGLAGLPVMLSWHLYLLFVPVLLIVLPALVQRRQPCAVGSASARALRHAMVGGGFFLLLWPVFFRPAIYPRFVFGGVALALVALLFVLDRALSRNAAPADAVTAPAWHRSLAVVALLLPALSENGLPGQVAFMARFALAAPERLFTEGPTGWRMQRELITINQHRRRVSPGAGFFARATLMDMEGSYLLDGTAFRLGKREYQWLESRLGGAAAERCPWLVLQRLDIAYLRTRTSFDAWPERYRRLIPLFPRLDAAGRVRYVDPAALARLAASEPPCGDGGASQTSPPTSPSGRI